MSGCCFRSSRRTISGSRWQEVRAQGRGDREAFVADETTGPGTVLAAISESPFRVDTFVQNAAGTLGPCRAPVQADRGIRAPRAGQGMKAPNSGSTMTRGPTSSRRGRSRSLFRLLRRARLLGYDPPGGLCHRIGAGFWLRSRSFYAILGAAALVNWGGGRRVTGSVREPTVGHRPPRPTPGSTPRVAGGALGRLEEQHLDGLEPSPERDLAWPLLPSLSATVSPWMRTWRHIRQR